MDNFVVGDLLFSSSNTLVLQAVRKGDGKKVVLKKTAENYSSLSVVEAYKKDFQLAKMLHEYSPESFVNMLEIIEEKDGSVILVEEEEGLKLFAEKRGKLTIEEFLVLAKDMALTLHCAHSKLVLHRDIKLANFIFSSDLKKPKLIDFGLSTVLSRKSPSISCTKPIGTYAYMSPEQTGRVSKNVDFRSDIYSLGICFYELLVGSLPFTGDKMSIVHAQITKKIPNIPNVPKPINEIIQKMCHKNPSDRYYSAFGVAKDLEFVAENLSALNFQIGKHDVKPFRIPNQLYGRDEQLSQLKEAIKSSTESNICLVSGYSGMGKSKLVEELLKDQNMKLVLCYGKFDQFNRLNPYSAFLNTLKSLSTKLISESTKTKHNVIDVMKLEINSELGGVLTSYVPEIEYLIGKQETPEALGKIEDNQKRFFTALVNFYSCFTGENTLVLVLDDLQWADSSSLQFSNHLLLLKPENIFIIGAYRDNEVNSTHPLMDIIKHQNIQNIHLQPLTLENLNEMLSDTLELPKNDTLKLSELVHKKTGGNPFFSREFINTLYEEELITLKDGQWVWDIGRIEKMDFSSNVINFMIENLKKMPKATQKLLNRAACIGNVFKVEELKWVWDESSAIESELNETVEEGWINQLTSSEYQFFHDRLQQASYELYDENERMKIHLVIGTALLDQYKKQDAVDEHIFNIINHLNNAEELFQDKRTLLQLNLTATVKSMENSAHAIALKFANVSMKLLPVDSWDVDYELNFKTLSIYANALYMNSLLEESEKYYNILLEKAKGRHDLLKVYTDFMKMASLSVQFDKAYILFLKAFKMFSVAQDIPVDSVPESIGWIMQMKGKIEAVITEIGGYNNIMNLKPCLNVETLMLNELIFQSIDSVFMAPTANPVMFVIMALSSFYMMLTEGVMTDTAPITLAFAGWIYSFFFRDPNGRILGNTSEKLLSQQKNIKFGISPLRFVLAISCMTGGTMKQLIHHHEFTINYGMTHGEYLFSTYSANNLGMAYIFNGIHFPTLLAKLKKFQAFTIQIKATFIVDALECQIHCVSGLLGLSEFDPKYLTPNFKLQKSADSCSTALESTYYYHLGEYEKVYDILSNAGAGLEGNMGLTDYYENRFYYCLILIRMYKKHRDEGMLKKIQEFLQFYECFGQLGPDYLFPRHQLLAAYYHSITETDIMVSLNKLEEALELSNKCGLLIISAITAELILEFCDERKFPKGLCKHYYSILYKIWSSLAAKRKCELVKKKFFRYASTSKSDAMLSESTSIGISSTQTESVQIENESLDMISIIKASQALSVELTISNLITKVLQIILENTGAEAALLFLSHQKSIILEASLKNNTFTSIQKDVSEFQENESFCSFLFKLSKNTKKTIIINDVSDSEYADNPYLFKEKIKSLCIHPFFKNNKYIGSVYLENKTLEGIFDERKEILQHICSQLAISYENAKLYDDVNSLNVSFERFLPKEFLNQLGKGDVRNIQLGDAATKNISVLFSDIRNFTNLTEKMNSKESFSFINGILAHIAPVIAKNNGFIDKILGDSIMAIFPNSVDDSIKCGYEILTALKVYNFENRKGLDPVRLGIGIHYGNAMMGTIGSEDRIDATVISDTVNTASRVESLTKELGATFIVTEDLLQNSSLNFKKRYIGKYLLKGKDIPMSLFQILHEEYDQMEILNIEEFTKGMLHFESRNFKDAEMIFKSLKDRTSKYLELVSKKYNYYIFDDLWNGEIKIDKDGNLVDLENKSRIQHEIEKKNEEEKMKMLKDLMNENKIEELLVLIANQKPEKFNFLIEK